MKFVVHTPDDLGTEVPWAPSAHSMPHTRTRNSYWHGEIVSQDNTAPINIFDDRDVERVLAYWSDPADWSGSYATLLQLHDGRFVSWADHWDATGSGFYEDAYGGHATVHVAMDFEVALRQIPERERELLIWSTYPDQEPLVAVLHDCFQESPDNFERACAIARESGEFGPAWQERVRRLWSDWED